MSVSVLIYLAAVAVLWPPCTFAVRRVSAQGLLDRVVAGLITAMAWPMTIPILGIASLRRTGFEPPRATLEVVSDGLEVLAFDAPTPTAVAVNS